MKCSLGISNFFEEISSLSDSIVLLQFILNPYKATILQTTWRDVVGRETGGVFRMEETHVYVWLIHTDVWKKSSQYFIIQLK